MPSTKVNRMQDQIAAILGDASTTTNILTHNNMRSPTTNAALVMAGAVSRQHSSHHHHAHKDEHEDCMSTALSSSSTAATHLTSSTTMAELDELLDGLVNAVHIQLDQERFLDSRICEHVQLAAAQRNQGAGQELGVILSMNMVHRMQMARQRVNLAIQLLQGHIESIESQLECHQQQQHQQHPDHDDDDMLMNAEDEEVCIDVSAQRKYAEQVQAILSAPLSGPASLFSSP
jgi:hypothetical protein